jgi:hypothetical protein
MSSAFILCAVDAVDIRHVASAPAKIVNFIAKSSLPVPEFPDEIFQSIEQPTKPRRSRPPLLWENMADGGMMVS